MIDFLIALGSTILAVNTCMLYDLYQKQKLVEKILEKMSNNIVHLAEATLTVARTIEIANKKNYFNNNLDA
jgi:hypothetical protein